MEKASARMSAVTLRIPDEHHKRRPLPERLMRGDGVRKRLIKGYFPMGSPDVTTAAPAGYHYRRP
jgi:hypothetical protein